VEVGSIRRNVAIFCACVVAISVADVVSAGVVPPFRPDPLVDTSASVPLGSVIQVDSVDSAEASTRPRGADSRVFGSVTKTHAASEGVLDSAGIAKAALAAAVVVTPDAGTSDRLSFSAQAFAFTVRNTGTDTGMFWLTTTCSGAAVVPNSCVILEECLAGLGAE
jgi:hypothetical protein